MAKLVTGATGFIGSALIDSWLEQDPDQEILGLTRNPQALQQRFKGKVTPVTSLDDINNEQALSVIVNLAGEPILDKRWTEERKHLLYDSRINITTELVGLIKRLEQPPEVFISGSAIGYYGNQQDDLQLDELQEGHPSFSHQLCHDWENVALQVEEVTRVCLVRTGIVLGPGGALGKMLPPFKMGLGGPIASGDQWMSWIDLTDMIAGINYLIQHQTLQGPFNLTAPEPVSNRDFTKSLAKTLHRPAFFLMPAFVLQLMLGEGAELLVEGQRVVPAKLLEAGYEFQYPTLDASLAHWL